MIQQGINLRFSNKNCDNYYQSALNLKLPVRLLPEIDGFEVFFGKKRYFFRGAHHHMNGYTSANISKNKYSTLMLLKNAGFPVPNFKTISEQDCHEHTLEQWVSDLNFPLVAKPTVDGRRGEGVVCNIKTIKALQSYLHDGWKTAEFINIEEFHNHLNSYRVLVLKGKVIGIVKRFPAMVLGDGQHTIHELIKRDNVSREKTNEILKPIIVDEECLTCLDEAGLALDDIPQEGQIIQLGYTTNTSRGGTVISLGDKIPKANEQYFAKAARVVDLNLVGFDVLCEDIYKPFSSSKGVFIETNFSPSTRIHEEFGIKPVRVTRIILKDIIKRHPFRYAIHRLTLACNTFYARILLASLGCVALVWMFGHMV